MSCSSVSRMHMCRGRKIGLEIARGLAYLHSKKVIHFDMCAPVGIPSLHTGHEKKTHQVSWIACCAC